MSYSQVWPTSDAPSVGFTYGADENFDRNNVRTQHGAIDIPGVDGVTQIQTIENCIIDLVTNTNTDYNDFIFQLNGQNNRYYRYASTRNRLLQNGKFFFDFFY